MSRMVTISFDRSLPASVATWRRDDKDFVWQFLGRHDRFINDTFEPESNRTLKMRLLRNVPIVLAVHIVTGVSCLVGRTLGPR